MTPSSKKALVVEGSDDVRRAITAVLSLDGFSVLQTRDPYEAVRQFEESTPQITLVDLSLPDKTGLELLRKLRSLDAHATLIGVTSSPDDREALSRARSQGVTSFVLKGPGIAAFTRTLTNSLREIEPKQMGPLTTIPATSQPHVAQRHRILVADDEPNICKVLKRFLEGKGYEVATAANGLEALEAARALKPIVTLLDIDMPEMNGLEALPRLRQENPRMGILMITGNTDEEKARECMRLGASDYIAKPLNFDYLETSVLAKIIVLT